MNNLHSDITNYTVVHGRAGIELYNSYLVNNIITINPDVFVYTIVDKYSAGNAFITNSKISNNSIHIIEIETSVVSF